MKISINNIGDSEFIIKYKEESYTINKENSSIEIWDVEEKSKIFISQGSKFDSIKAMNIVHWIMIIFITLLLYMIDLIGPNIQSFSKLLNHPISEKYTLIPASKEETYILTYHSSRLESITGRYYYPYMTDSDNNKLHVEYSYDPQNLNAGCIFALIYHTYTAILSSFVIGLAVATISGKSFWICMGMSFVFVMLIIVLLLNRVKKTLLKQLL